MRMRLGLLQDPEVIERQIAREVREAEAFKKKAQIPTVKTEEEMKAEEAMTAKEKEEIKKRLEKKPRIRPLPEAKAIELGANFVSETFIFTVGISVILFENWRQRRKARNQRDDIREDLEEMQAELKSVKAELEEYKTLAKEQQPTGGKLFGLWKGKNAIAKPDEHIPSEQKTDNEAQPPPVLSPTSPEHQPEKSQVSNK